MSSKGLTTFRAQEIKATFDLCDTDGSGEVHAKELETVMRNMGFRHSPEEVSKMMAQAAHFEWR